MTRSIRIVFLWAAVLATAGCGGSRPAVEYESPEPVTPPGVVQLTFLHINDVYEITPVEGGRRGGLARLATLRNRLLDENPNTYVVIGGDFFSPSALGTARIDGERMAGRQMVASLNVMGLDVATFGNHEFDLPEDQFLSRLEESTFLWVSSNVFDAAGRPFPGVSENIIFTARGSFGEVARVGIFGLTIDSNPQDYVTYTDYLEAARTQVELLRGSADVIIGLTHLALDQDRRLTEEFPEIDLILGGHEHENWQVWRGTTDTPILKADANARTAYVVEISFDVETGDVTILPRLQVISDELPEDPLTAEEVARWVDAGFAAFRESGFDPENVVAEVPIALDGLESSVRNTQTELTQLIADAILAEDPPADLSVYNSGSIRIDDVIPPGPITEYDVIRVLPFGGPIVSVELSGEMLIRVLDQGRANRGSGGFLQWANVAYDDERGWRVKDGPIDPEQPYRVATSDFLVSGRETGLSYLNVESPEVTLLETRRDIRNAVIDELRRRY